MKIFFVIRLESIYVNSFHFKPRLYHWNYFGRFLGNTIWSIIWVIIIECPFFNNMITDLIFTIYFHRTISFGIFIYMSIIILVQYFFIGDMYDE